MGKICRRLRCDSEHKARSIKHGWMSLVWKNLTGPHKALTSTPSNTAEVNCNGDCEPGFLIQNQCLTSQMLCWINGQKSPQKHYKIKWKAFESSGSHYSCKMGTKPILRSMYLDCNVLVTVGLMQYICPYSVTVVRESKFTSVPQIKVSAFSRDKTCLRCLKTLPR